MVKIQVPVNSENTRIRISDMSGKVVFEQIIIETSMEINVDGIASGAYLVNVFNDNASAVQKLIIE
ncbi:MAG: T9SS type A sorting domain-containing protein [Crocinitomicaceae bacterium]|nr:T9SS type A sorting domain-containing protein [Crocinitomicaceae bacterium]